MEKNSHYFIIGIFVSISLVGLALFTIWLAGTHDNRNYKRYTIYFHDAVSGLKSSAIVQYRGVDVGRVMDVRLSPERNDLINVEVSSDTPIFKSTEASLAQQGMTGIVFIDLSTKEGDTTPPVAIEGELYPVIAGRGTQLSKLFQDVPAITSRILELTEKMNTVLSDDNVKNIDATFKNVQAMSASMNELLNEENIESTSVALRNLSQTSENINDLVARFDQTADKIDTAVDSMNEILTGNKGNIEKFSGSGLRQITDMATETKEMAKSIRRLADTLEQEPSRLLYQPNYRGVEIQK
jgi:phospholipid/cholesterol/gamma-HCH transport system substrate-binding protein